MSKPKKRSYGSAGFWIFNLFYTIMIFVSLFLSYSLSVNGLLSKESSLTIFGALLDVDIALIAFFGLILVFHLNYITGTKDRMAREKHETSIERDRFHLQHLLGVHDVNSDTLPSLENAYVEIDTEYARRIEELDKNFRSLVLQIFGVGIVGAMTIAYIFIDILLNVFYMGAVTSEGMSSMNLFWSLLVLLLSFYAITSSIIFTRPSIEQEIVSQDMKKRWKELSTGLREEWQKRRGKQ